MAELVMVVPTPDGQLNEPVLAAAHIAGVDRAFRIGGAQAVAAHEPTCIASRPSEYAGVPTSGDADGDGIADAIDNCQDVFNPLRPVDEGL